MYKPLFSYAPVKICFCLCGLLFALLGGRCKISSGVPHFTTSLLLIVAYWSISSFENATENVLQELSSNGITHLYKCLVNISWIAWYYESWGFHHFFKKLASNSIYTHSSTLLNADHNKIICNMALFFTAETPQQSMSFSTINATTHSFGLLWEMELFTNCAVCSFAVKFKNSSYLHHILLTKVSCFYIFMYELVSCCLNIFYLTKDLILQFLQFWLQKWC